MPCAQWWKPAWSLDKNIFCIILAQIFTFDSPRATFQRKENLVWDNPTYGIPVFFSSLEVACWFLLCLLYIWISSYCKIMVNSLSCICFTLAVTNKAPQKHPPSVGLLLPSVCFNPWSFCYITPFLFTHPCNSALMSFLKNERHLGKRQKQNHKEVVDLSDFELLWSY